MPLYPLTENDLDLILSWRNAPVVRKAMYTHHEISPKEHRAWFKRIRQDPSKRWYLYRDNSGAPQGVVYFNELDFEQHTGFWGFYAKPGAKPGTGKRMEYAALEVAFGELKLHKLNCEVLASNKTVVSMHQKVGFIQEGLFREQHFDGSRRIDVIRLGMLASEWKYHRELLCARI